MSSRSAIATLTSACVPRVSPGRDPGWCRHKQSRRATFGGRLSPTNYLRKLSYRLPLRLLQRGRRDPIDPYRVLSPLDDAEAPVTDQNVYWNAPYRKSLSRDAGPRLSTQTSLRRTSGSDRRGAFSATV